MVVHGDDFLSEGEAQELRWFDIELRKHFELKTEVLGPNVKNSEVQEIRFFNRVITWSDKGIVWEANPRHAELLIEQLGFQGVKEACSPGIKDEVKPRMKKEDDGNDGGDGGEVNGLEGIGNADIGTLMIADRWKHTGLWT